MVDPAISKGYGSKGTDPVWKEWRWPFISNPKEPQLWPRADSSTSSSGLARTKPMPDVRSRTGCLSCRKRRRKCDEVRPTCGGCQKRQLTCEYTTRVRWTPAKIPGAVFKKPPQPETKEQETPSPTVAPEVHNTGSLEPEPRGRSKFASRELPFHGIIHVGGSINYVSDDLAQDLDENMKDAEHSGDGGLPKGWALESFVGLLNPEHFSSMAEINAFAYCKSNAWEYARSSIDKT